MKSLLPCPRHQIPESDATHNIRWFKWLTHNRLFRRIFLSEANLINSSKRHFGDRIRLNKLLAVAGGICWFSCVPGAFGQITRSIDGDLAFQKDSDGYRITDFSHAGYQGGDENLPTYGKDYSKVVSLSHQTGDQTRRIQAALDAVAKLPVNANGFRGAVVLGAGTWRFSKLTLNHDGVILRGAGIDKTILESVAKNGVSIRIGGATNTHPSTFFLSGRSGEHWNILSNKVSVGDRTFTIQSNHPLKKGIALS